MQPVCVYGRTELDQEAAMRVRRSSIILFLVGIVLIVAAALLRFVVVPIATKLPGNTDLGITYAGKATMLNSSALQSGDTANVIAKDVPMTVDRRVKVTSTRGDTAIVTDNLTIHAGGQTLPSPHTFALDRTTLEGATPPNGVSVEPSKDALSSTFPLGPHADNSYRYYDSTTRQIVPVNYAGNATREGRSVNVYKFAPKGAVRDPGLLKLLPAALPKKLIAGLAPLLPAAVQAKITPATLAALPDPIPLSYTSTTDIAAYVDKQTGVPIDESIAQQVVVSVAAGSQSISLIPVLALDFRVTPASMKYLGDKASSAGRLLTLMTVIVPIALIVIGLVLVVVAVVRRRKPAPELPSAEVIDASGSRSLHLSPPR
jgi:hypothetical protein